MKKLAKIGMLEYAVVFTSAFLGIVISRLIINTLGMEYYGLISIFKPIFTIMSVVTAGMGMPYRTRYYKTYRAGDFIRTSKLISGLRDEYQKVAKQKIVFGLIMIITIPFLINDEAFSFMYLLIIYSILLISNIITTWYFIPSGMYKVTNQYEKFVIKIKTLPMYSQIFDLLVLLFFGIYLNLSASITLILLVMFRLSSNIIIRKRRLKVVKRDFPEINFDNDELEKVPVEKARSIKIRAAAHVVNSTLQQILVASVFGVFYFGIFSTYQSAAKNILRFVHPIYMPYATMRDIDLKSTTKFDEIISLNRKINGVKFIFLITFSVLFAKFGTTIVQLLYGHDETIVGLTIGIGAITLSRALTRSPNRVATANDIFTETTWVWIVVLLLRLGITLFLINLYGFIGLYAGFVIVDVIQYIIIDSYNYRKMGGTYFIDSIVTLVVPFLLYFSILWVII